MTKTIKRTDANRVVIYDYLYSITIHKTDKEISTLQKQQKELSKSSDDVHSIWITVCSDILEQRKNKPLYKAKIC